MSQVTNDELNTLVYAAFNGTFGKISFMTGLVSKAIINHKKRIRKDILKIIKSEIEETKKKGWNENMDKVCWARLLDELEFIE